MRPLSYGVGLIMRRYITSYVTDPLSPIQAQLTFELGLVMGS